MVRITLPRRPRPAATVARCRRRHRATGRHPRYAGGHPTIMERTLDRSRRALLKLTAAGVAGITAAAPRAMAQPASPGAAAAEDRVFICNEDSNTLSVIDPRT